MELAGLQVKLKLIDGQYLEGRIYALSQSTSTLILEQRSTSLLKNVSSFHLLKFESVESIELIIPNEEDIHLDVSTPSYVHVDRFAGRLQQAGIAFRKRLSKQGKNVTAEAQLIFDMISRTTPCRWEEPDIIVFDQIRVRPPYFTAESCSIMAGHDSEHKIPLENHEALQRVHRMLQAVKQRVFNT
jgi:protein LSM12